MLGLANNTCIKDTFGHIKDRFQRLYKRKAHLHHYTQVDGMDISLFEEAENSIKDLISDYKNMEKEGINNSNPDQATVDFIERIKILA